MLMKVSIFMRALFCKFHCPFLYFCKTSAAHEYARGPLKLETAQTPHVVGLTAQTPGVDGVSVNVTCKGGGAETLRPLKSCMRSIPSVTDIDNTKEVRKKRVQWIDDFGKELAEIKEYEPSEAADMDSCRHCERGSSRCMCVIL